MEYVKICGLKSKTEVDTCLQFGADAVGFIYNVPSSPRNLNKMQINSLLKNIDRKIKTVIVIKPREMKEIFDIMNDLPADYYQIHMDFKKINLEDLSEELVRKLIIGMRVNPQNIEKIMEFIKEHNNTCYTYLLDSSEGHAKVPNLKLYERIINEVNGTRIIIAGGINEENVGAIIKKLDPYGIDASSSLESVRGTKDLEKIKKFLEKIQKLREEERN